ncbi:cytochrome c oxidase, cbb3-type, CcoQ subunit [Helicobacter saguini]|uniref:Cytochrome c oxidase, cbb3-type, CcoQ subunit n=2 Tax=Helicobacter saguini TaxID=1548018 RepID=A0A347VU45_9HELI|nr:cytochrome c oxidase, cbb3-type, CcoQ subunit [Helicobacter saguini]MWV66269.1 cytochrome c oxidase, cbb3-type, CcoQ subunit [Helicobacter saguini]MWV68621.1 cytochrome c oxidase, cbb3-type, CcoQ subunit [Helicobacter saguini]MWV71828.1 cytochrome c oxidase, cbb3-type, CcoQ subunit [Helicobacter saguini]TLD95995.1 cytochrome c oxidase, cbb3-type, CcoQ subunit [Helicobacter saguini]
MEFFFSLKGIYFFSIVFLVIWLYSYIIYLYRAQRTGKVDYEKYAKLALNDDLNDELIESCDDTKVKGEDNGLVK